MGIFFLNISQIKWQKPQNEFVQSEDADQTRTPVKREQVYLNCVLSVDWCLPRGLGWSVVCDCPSLNGLLRAQSFFILSAKMLIRLS